nr:ammonium transporter [Geodermatophilus sabuli]
MTFRFNVRCSLLLQVSSPRTPRPQACAATGPRLPGSPVDEPDSRTRSARRSCLTRDPQVAPAEGADEPPGARHHELQTRGAGGVCHFVLRFCNSPPRPGRYLLAALGVQRGAWRSGAVHVTRKSPAGTAGATRTPSTAAEQRPLSVDERCAVDVGSTAFILAATMAVALMVPGLALFYGGMVGSRSVLNMIMMVFGAVAVVGVLWTLFGFSAVFGNSYGGLGLLGDVTEYLGLGDVVAGDEAAALPPALVAVFQALFAVITTALIAGAVSDRVRFGPWLLFTGLWAALVYFPVAHWVFAFDSADGSVQGGWIANTLGAVDFAGGTAVHINAGVAALALVLVVGKRTGWPRQARPNNLPLVALGAGILWFGWFGFNGGSALAAGNSASVVMLTTFNATCAAILAWLLVERLRDGHATTLGGMSGAIAGLVAITPACGAVTPLGALAVGAIAGAVCPLAITLKYRFGYDDALDVVGVHLVGGVVGTLLVGLFGSAEAPSGKAGLFYGGGFGLLGTQAVAVVAVVGYSFLVSLLIALVVKHTVGLRASKEGELAGHDLTEHAEVAYDLEGGVHTPGSGPTPEAVIASAERLVAGSVAAPRTGSGTPG